MEYIKWFTLIRLMEDYHILNRRSTNFELDFANEYHDMWKYRCFWKKNFVEEAEFFECSKFEHLQLIYWSVSSLQTGWHLMDRLGSLDKRMPLCSVKNVQLSIYFARLLKMI